VTIQISVDDAELEAVISRIEGSQAQLDGKVDDVAKKAQSVVSNEGSEIKGIETSIHRIARMIPGVREVDRTYKAINKLSSGNIMGALGLFFIAWRVIRMINQYLDQIKRQQQEMEAYIRQTRGITSHTAYNQYQYQQRIAINSYRNVNR
jgi:hypothetical protein